MSGTICIGTSGWNYRHWWDGVFYPKEVKQKAWLEYYARFFDTVEINSTFYRLPLEKTVENWHSRVPPDFTYIVKASRIITHLKKLQDAEEIIGTFLNLCAGFKEKLGAVLFQTPPSMKADAERLSRTIDIIRGHRHIGSVRVVFEFRNTSWFADEIYRILAGTNTCLCFSDMPGLETEDPVTADFVYVRRHGASGRYSGCYSEEDLKTEARAIRKWAKDQKDVYVYYNNDIGGHAVRNALRLKELLGQE